jgi:AcrR family transcriptional regulator
MPKPKKTYHRPNLEESLIEKAAEIIASRGVDALSLRELGRCADVSRTAPYHYFPDKAALLFKVGELGFRRLGERIAREIGDVSLSLEQLRLGLRGYVLFALEDEHFFRLMFADVLRRDLPSAPSEQGPALLFSSEAAQATFMLLLDGILRLQREGLMRPADPGLLLNVLWAYTHGVAVLALDRHLKHDNDMAVFDAGLDALLHAYAV